MIFFTNKVSRLAFLRNLGITLISIGLFACGALDKALEQKPIDKSENIVQFEGLWPLVFEMAHPECGSDQALTDLGKQSFWANVGGEVKLTTLDFHGYSGNGMSGPGVAGVFRKVNWKLGAECEVAPSRDPDLEPDYDCKRYVESPKIDVPVTICTADGSYPRDSIESLALATLAGVMQAHQLLGQIIEGEEIEPVHLLIHPIVTLYDIHAPLEDLGGKVDASLKLTDNSFWFHDPIDGKDFISTLPHSAQFHDYFDSVEGFKDRNLWEYVGVSAHEYGHHVMRVIAPDLQGVGVTPTEGLDESSEPKYIKHRLTISAIGEGLADYWAFSAYDFGNNSLGQLSLFSTKKDRDVAFGLNDDGDPKDLSTITLDHYFSDPQSDENSFRNHTIGGSVIYSANWSDSHTVGAAIAYGFHKIALASSRSEAWTSKDAGRFVVVWLKELNQRLNSASESTNDRTFFEQSLVAGLESLAKDMGGFNKDQCHVVNKVFSAVAKSVSACSAIQ